MKMTHAILVFAGIVLVSTIVLGDAYKKRNKRQGSITVTGLSEKKFTSDLIVWEGRFSANNYNLQSAFEILKSSKNKITKYLTDKGLASESFLFTAVSTNELTEAIYGPEGEFQGRKFTGYELNQGVVISSSDVGKIEIISREITELLNLGVQLYSGEPRYYYTKLEELKIDMISIATENARLRAETIAENSGSDLGDLIDGKMGIFQIIGQYSGEDYSWGGTYNTSSKDKTATITMKLEYEVD